MADCPCCSGKSYESCCNPIIDRKALPETASEMMRARYSAYATGNVDFIKYSSCPEIQKSFDEESTRKWAEGAEWNDLEIISTTGGEKDDTTGTVEFLAHYTIEDNLCNHHEEAEFIKDEGVWKFLDGKVSRPDPIRRDAPKIGRNDPCPCDSGRKYKKCCALKKNDTA